VNPLEPAEPEPEAPGPADSVWDSCPWLDTLRAVPENGAWPRLMTAPHPEAVGSYWTEAATWLDVEAGLRLRWWQQLLMARALEHDSSGRLLWLTVLVSTPRQVGKSVALRAAATWRMHQAERFGEEQLVLHTGKDLPVCNEVQRAARIWARGRPGYVVREQNGNEEVGYGDSRWLVRGRYSVYGYAVSMGLVDEAWGVLAEVVDDGIEPTMGDRTDPQLWLVSTAHRRATSLYPLRRATTLASLAAPARSLMLEWSATRDTGVDDQAAWQAASPYWTDHRQALLADKLARVQAGVSEDPDEDDPVESFRSQWLNMWPARRLVLTTREEPLLEADAWTAAANPRVAPPNGPVVVAVEDWFGLGAAAAAAAVLADGRVLVWGDLFEDRSDAIAWAAYQVQARPGSALLVGASLPVGQVADTTGLQAMKAGGTELRTALPLLRTLTRQGRLVHGGDPAMAAQVTGCRVSARETGLAIPNRAHRSDLVRCLAWAVQGCLAGITPPPRPAVF
jgi:hypothetical protein